jgi:ATP-dependent Clp protease ATP-binding subunit ClpA
MSSRSGPPTDVFTPAGQVRDELFRDDAIHALRQSENFARRTGWDSIRSPHVFMGLLDSDDPGILEWAERLGADVPQLLDQFEELFRHDRASDDAVIRLHREFMSDNVIRLLRDAVQRAGENNREVANPLDVLIAMLTAPSSIVAECFERIGITAARLTELAVLAEHAAAREA